MAVLYVDEYGSSLHHSAGRIFVEKDGRELAGVRIRELEMVVLQENCGVTSSAIGALLRNGIDLAIVSHGGNYLGRLESAVGKNIVLRRQQYRMGDNPAFCLLLARRFAAAKLANMRTLVMRYSRGGGVDLGKCADSLRECAAKAGAADSLPELLGLEGSGSSAYFQALRSIVKSPFEFSGRNRRPPLDPVNAMLGFAYALLEGRVERSVCLAGLDPHCGFFHQEQYGRQSLVLDLMEEPRPVIADSVALNCCGRHIVDPKSDFESRDGGIFLNESGRQKLFAAFHARMSQAVTRRPGASSISYDAVCLEQARSLAACIRKGAADYEPFLVK